MDGRIGDRTGDLIEVYGTNLVVNEWAGGRTDVLAKELMLE